MKRRMAQLAVLVLACVVLLGAGDDTGKRFDTLGHKLMCKCGCNQVLLECNHVGCTYSERMREELMAGIDRGDSDDLVLQAFVQKYGPTVLSAPTTTGFNVIAWIMPFVALATGMAMVVLIVRAWKRRWTPVPVAGTANLMPQELDELRRRAREETAL